MTDDVLVGALQRVLAGTTRLCRLAAGSEPARTPNGLCAWCTALHVIIFVMLLITVVNLQEPELAEEFDVEEEEPLATTKRNR